MQPRPWPRPPGRASGDRQGMRPPPSTPTPSRPTTGRAECRGHHLCVAEGGKARAVCAGRRAGPGSASRIWGVGSLSPSQRSRSVLSPRSPGACDRHSVWVPACFTDDITRAPSRSRALKFQGGKYVLWEKANAENRRQLFWARFRLRRSN